MKEGGRGRQGGRKQVMEICDLHTLSQFFQTVALACTVTFIAQKPVLGL